MVIVEPSAEQSVKLIGFEVIEQARADTISSQTVRSDRSAGVLCTIGKKCSVEDGCNVAIFAKVVHESQ